MTVFYGSEGSLNLYYKGLLVSSFGLTKKKTFQSYQYQGEYLILRSMRDNYNIKRIIYTFTHFCNSIYQRKKNKQAIRRGDHEMFLGCLFALMRLKIIDNDELNGYLIMPKKKTI